MEFRRNAQRDDRRRRVLMDEMRGASSSATGEAGGQAASRGKSACESGGTRWLLLVSRIGCESAARDLLGSASQVDAAGYLAFRAVGRRGHRKPCTPGSTLKPLGAAGGSGGVGCCLAGKPHGVVFLAGIVLGRGRFDHGVRLAPTSAGRLPWPIPPLDLGCVALRCREPGCSH